MKVGDYVRTNVERLNLQQICKIKKILSDDFIFTDRGYYDKEYIIKSSPNIMDLIEVGDYVNGHKVSEIIIDKNIVNNDKLKFGDEDLALSFKGNNDTYYLYLEDIKSVVTHEQFESMQYNLESEVN